MHPEVEAYWRTHYFVPSPNLWEVTRVYQSGDFGREITFYEIRNVVDGRTDNLSKYSVRRELRDYPAKVGDRGYRRTVEGEGIYRHLFEVTEIAGEVTAQAS